MISPLPSSSPLPFSSPLTLSSPLLLSSPLFFFPLPLPLEALEVTVSSLLSPDWVVVAPSTRTQVPPPDEVISGAEVEAVDVDVCVSEFPQLLVLSAAVEAAKVDARRVGDSSLAGVEFSLEGPLNHELSQENKPAEGTKQTERKEQGESEAQLLQTEREEKAKSDEQSKKSSYGFSLLCQGRQNKHF